MYLTYTFYINCLGRDDGLEVKLPRHCVCQGTPKEVPKEVMKPLFVADPDTVNLERRLKELYTKIKWEYKFIKQALKKVRKEYKDLCKQLKNMKKSLEDKIKDIYRKDYFFQ